MILQTPVSNGQDGSTKHTLVNTCHSISCVHTATDTDNTCAVFELKLVQGMDARTQQLFGLFYQLSGLGQECRFHLYMAIGSQRSSAVSTLRTPTSTSALKVN